MTKLKHLILPAFLITLISSFGQENLSSSHLGLDSAEITITVYEKTGCVVGTLNSIRFNLGNDSTVVRFWDTYDTFKESKVVTVSGNKLDDIVQYENSLEKFRIDRLNWKNTDYQYIIMFEDRTRTIEYKISEEESLILKKWFDEFNDR